MSNISTRRDFVRAGLGAAAALSASAAPKNALPRWRGFNLLYLFQARRQKARSRFPKTTFA
jgi:hypothetical protein